MGCNDSGLSGSKARTALQLLRASVKRPPERAATEIFFYSKRQGGTNRPARPESMIAKGSLLLLSGVTGAVWLSPRMFPGTGS
jgi:hypothetical protein